VTAQDQRRHLALAAGQAERTQDAVEHRDSRRRLHDDGTSPVPPWSSADALTRNLRPSSVRI
jgi:hypothetical protein